MPPFEHIVSTRSPFPSKAIAVLVALFAARPASAQTPAPPANPPPETPAPAQPPPELPPAPPPPVEVPPATSAVPEAPTAAPPTSAPPAAPPNEPQPKPTAAGEPKTETSTVKGKWNPVLYGFVETDFILDTTQSFTDRAGNNPVARNGSYAGDHDRFMISPRNTRIGFRLEAPEMAGIKPTAMIETDFLGSQPPTTSESAVFTSPLLRIRHAMLKLENPVVTVLIGQYWELFGWQSYFHPTTVEIQGVPGQVYSRAPQLRLSHVFDAGAVSVELAVAASRPPQRDAGVPDGQAGLRLKIDDWKGVHTLGATGTGTDAAAIGFSSTVRRFRVPEFSATPTASNAKDGWGISVDAMLPIIPGTVEERGNALTFTGSFVTGTGISDLFTDLTGGITFPTLPNPTGASPAPTYSPGLDNGEASFDPSGNFRTIDWQFVIVGLQYYLPPSGHFWVAANYSHSHSKNIAEIAGPSQASKVFKTGNWVDGNLFWEPFPPLRFGAEYAFFQQTYADGKEGKNHRFQISGYYIF
jgi:hypothetical protein